MANTAALDQISLLTSDTILKLQSVNQAVAAADILSAITASRAIEGHAMAATLIADQLGVSTAQLFRDLATVLSADPAGSRSAALQSELAEAQNVQLQAEAGIVGLEAMAKQAGAAVQRMLQDNPALVAAIDANPGALAAKVEDLNLKGIHRQTATTADAAFHAVEMAYATLATTEDPVAAHQRFLETAIQALDAQTNLLVADQNLASSQLGLAAAELTALSFALQGTAESVQSTVPAPQDATAVRGKSPDQVPQAMTTPAESPNLEVTDRPTVWKGTELHQSFSFNLADLSLLANKALDGRMRALSSLANNSLSSHEDRSRAALGTTPVDTLVTSHEYGSGDDEFIRISDVNNYPGSGDISQGLNGAPTSGRMQLQGPDGRLLPNERIVSNTLMDQGHADIPEKEALNNLFMGAGQYLDHGQSLLNKGGQGSFSIPLSEDDVLYGKVPGNELQLLPRGTSVDTTPGHGRYMNTVTATIDQNQLYGSDDILHGYLREKISGVMTAKMLDNKWSAPNTDGSAGLPTFYDVLINNGADKDALDTVLNDPTYQQAHIALSAWDAKVRAGDSSVTGDLTKDGMENHLRIISSSNQALKAAAGDAWLNPTAVLPGSNQQLLGDANYLARFDAISLASHRIAGDLRVNENPQLTAFHTSFANFHNNTVDAIIAALDQLPPTASATPGLEQLVALKENLGTQEGQQAVFDMARMVLNAGYQRMVYDQYVVALSGGIGFGITEAQDRALTPDSDKLLSQPLVINEHGFNGWQPEVRPSIGLEYSTSGFRVGHSQINETLNGMSLETANEMIAVNDRITKSLIESFVNPSALEVLGGAAAVLSANAREHSQAVDTWMVDAVRNMLVGRPNDLGSFNLARNNELGIPTLNEFRQSLSSLLKTSEIANSLGAQASDASVGLIDADGNTNLLSERLRPYATWQEFKQNLRDPDQVQQFMQLYGGDRATLDNNIGLINVPLWLGGLAEKPVQTPTREGDIPSLMGATFTYIVQETFDRAQDFDRWYYKLDIAGTDILKQLSFQTFTPMLQTSLGKAAQFIHQDTFRTFTIDSMSAQSQSFEALQTVMDVDGSIINRLILGNSQASLIKGSEGSDDIRAGSGDDTVNGSGGKDWIFGQAGNDRLSGGDDHAIDHIFGGDGADLLLADDRSQDALFGENGDDILIRADTGGVSDGGLGHDLLLGGKDDDVLYGDSGSQDDNNYNGNDTIIAGQGDDTLIGGDGDDLLIGGESVIRGDVIMGDAKADANAELLSRALRNENGEITGTILPLFTELGYAVTVGGLNPQTGQRFSDQEIAEFETYIMGLRKVYDPDHPSRRGPQPVMILMPYTGDPGDDVIYIGDKPSAWDVLMNTYAGDARLDALIASRDNNDLTVERQSSNNLETVDHTLDLSHTDQEHRNQVDSETQSQASRIKNQPASMMSPSTIVFSGGGDDTVYTDSNISAKVFAGAGFDTLNASSQNEIQFLQINQLGPDGAEGSLINARATTDEFYGVESFILSGTGQNSLVINDDISPLSINMAASDSDQAAIIESLGGKQGSIRVSGANNYIVGNSLADRLVLSGKLDYDNELDDDRSDDNYIIKWNGDSLSVEGSNMGSTMFRGVEWVEFNSQASQANDHGVKKVLYYKEFAEKALHVGIEIVDDSALSTDRVNELVIRRFGNEQELNRRMYLAVTAESLLDATIDTIDLTINLGSDFANVFQIDPANVMISDQLAVQRHVELIQSDAGPAIRVTGAGLSALGAGTGISGQSIVAYVELKLRDDIDEILYASRTIDANGFLNKDSFVERLGIHVDANVDEVIFSDQRSLRDLGGQYAMRASALDLNVRAAQAVLSTDSQFELGTERSIVKPGEGARTNLIRSGDIIFQSSYWRNDGEFTLKDIAITDHSNNVANVISMFDDGTSLLNQLSWNQSAETSPMVAVNTWFQVTGSAGSVLNTQDVGFSLDAYGGYSWDTREMNQFAAKHLITFASDLNYDGRVGMKDLAALNAGAANGSSAHDVDANYDGLIDILDLAVLDAEWGKTLHSGVDDFIGSSAISMTELKAQGHHTWDSSAFILQNTIESGSLQAWAEGHERDYVSPLGAERSAVSSMTLPMEIPALITGQDQEYAITRG